MQKPRFDFADVWQAYTYWPPVHATGETQYKQRNYLLPARKYLSFKVSVNKHLQNLGLWIGKYPLLLWRTNHELHIWNTVRIIWHLPPGRSSPHIHLQTSNANFNKNVIKYSSQYVLPYIILYILITYDKNCNRWTPISTANIFRPISSSTETPKDKWRLQIELPTPQAKTIHHTYQRGHRVFAVLSSYVYFTHRYLVSCYHRFLFIYTRATHNFQWFEQVISMLFIVNLAWTFSLYFLSYFVS